MKNCLSCTSQIELDRLEVLPDTRVCASCARQGNGQRPKVKGSMCFDHKTGGSIQVLTPQEFAQHRRYNPYGKNTGRGSGVHRMMSYSCK